MHVQFSLLQSLDRLGRRVGGGEAVGGGGMAHDSAEIRFQCFMRETFVGRSGMGRNAHCVFYRTLGCKQSKARPITLLRFSVHNYVRICRESYPLVPIAPCVYVCVCVFVCVCLSDSLCLCLCLCLCAYCGSEHLNWRVHFKLLFKQNPQRRDASVTSLVFSI